MTAQTQPLGKSDTQKNRLLDGLQIDDHAALMHGAKLVLLKYKKRLLLQDARVDAAYFPLTSMVSLLVTNDGKPQIEMATIGNEGVVGAAQIVHGQGSLGLALVQIAGTAVRIEANAFRVVLSDRPAVKALIHKHTYTLMRQILYGARRGGHVSDHPGASRPHARSAQGHREFSNWDVEEGWLYPVCARKAHRGRPAGPGISLMRMLSGYCESASFIAAQDCRTEPSGILKRRPYHYVQRRTDKCDSAGHITFRLALRTLEFRRMILSTSTRMTTGGTRVTTGLVTQSICQLGCGDFRP